jgi:aryl-alcohol dehydrogenase-like predicted oxidoreductase
MNKRPLGNTGIMVSEIGFGAWQLGNKKDWSLMSDNEAIALVHQAIDMGCNFFDTAPNYGMGSSETILGKALKGRRQNVVISTKFGHFADDSTDFDFKKLRPSVENSLKLLHTDYVDSVLLHNPPFELFHGKNPHYQEMEQLKKEGKIRAYGASVDWSKEMMEIINTTDCQVMEVLFNIFHQEPASVFSKAKEKGIGLIIKVPLDSGWLSGKYNSKSNFQGIRSRWSADIIKRRSSLVDQIRFITHDGSSMTQAALRFILAYPEVSTVIPGPKTADQLIENLSSGDKRMPEETVRKLCGIWEKELKDNPLPW